MNLFGNMTDKAQYKNIISNIYKKIKCQLLYGVEGTRKMSVSLFFPFLFLLFLVTNKNTKCLFGKEEMHI